MEKTAVEVREQICETGRAMLEEGLTQQTFGNVSARVDDETLAITPSGVPYHDLTPSDVPLITESGEVVESTYAVSSETPIHLAVYRAREDAGAIIHTHSPFATVYACLDEPIRPYHNTLAAVGGEVEVSDYANNGTDELAAAAVEALGEGRACLLKHHGVLTIGRTVREAHYAATIVEFCARMQYFATRVGDPETVSSDDLEELSQNYRLQMSEK